MLFKPGFCQGWSVITSKHLLCFGLFGHGLDAAISNLSAERGNWLPSVEM